METEPFDIYRKLTPEELERLEALIKKAVECYGDALRYLAER